MSVFLGLLLSFILVVFFIFEDSARKLAAFDNMNDRNIAKGTTDPRVEFISQVPHKS